MSVQSIRSHRNMWSRWLHQYTCLRWYKGYSRIRWYWSGNWLHYIREGTRKYKSRVCLTMKKTIRKKEKERLEISKYYNQVSDQNWRSNRNLPIDTCSSIQTRTITTVVDTGLTEIASPTRSTTASVRIDSIYATRPVETSIINAVVNDFLAELSSVTYGQEKGVREEGSEWAATHKV